MARGRSRACVSVGALDRGPARFWLARRRAVVPAPPANSLLLSLSSQRAHTLFWCDRLGQGPESPLLSTTLLGCVEAARCVRPRIFFSRSPLFSRVFLFFFSFFPFFVPLFLVKFVEHFAARARPCPQPTTRSVRPCTRPCACLCVSALPGN